MPSIVLSILSVRSQTSKQSEMVGTIITLQRRQWHPTPVLLPGKSHGQRAWWTVVHVVAKSQTRLSDFTFTFHFPALEKEMATHSSVLAWRIPGMGEPGGLPSIGSHRVGHDWGNTAAAAASLHSFHKWWNCYTEKLSLLPKFTQLVCVRVKV